MDIQRSFEPGKGAGSLYLVGTPIGNLQDITYRAVSILKQVAWIAAEDTRQTRKLLSFYQIPTRLVSYHEHNKHASGAELIRFLLAGESVALVSDAGLPVISDPGSELVRLAIENHIDVIAIPGANAALCALIACGLPADRFLFCGFLPRGHKALAAELMRLRTVNETMIFYEAPHRIVKTLQAMHQAWGNRRMALARELTKKFEEIARGTLLECIAFLQEHPPKGEYCIVAEAGGEAESTEEESVWWRHLGIERHVAAYIDRGYEQKEAIKLAAMDREVPKREVYNQWIKTKESPDHPHQNE